MSAFATFFAAPWRPRFRSQRSARASAVLNALRSPEGDGYHPFLLRTSRDSDTLRARRYISGLADCGPHHPLYYCARQSRIGGSTITQPESVEARAKNDEITVFALATPIPAGPSAMSGAMLLMANASGHPLNQIAVIGVLLTVMAFTLALLLAAQEIRDWIA
jgi:hypothetical protein